MPSTRDDSFQRFGGSWYSMVTSRESCFSQTSVLLPESRDGSYYVSQRIPAPPPLWLQKHTGLTRTRLHALFNLWRHPMLANVACICSRRRFGINPGVLPPPESSLLKMGLTCFCEIFEFAHMVARWQPINHNLNRGTLTLCWRTAW